MKLVRAVDMRCFDLTEGGIRPILSEVRRVLAAITLMVLLVAVSGGLWAWWAENEYRGLSSCPYGVPGYGHPVRVALGLISASAVIMLLPSWVNGSRWWWAWFAGLTALLAAVVIFVLATFVGASLRCMD